MYRILILNNYFVYLFQNKKLQIENQRLREENIQLRLGQEAKSEENTTCPVVEPMLPIESAEFFYGPLQKEQGDIQFKTAKMVVPLILLLSWILAQKSASQQKNVNQNQVLKMLMQQLLSSSPLSLTQIRVPLPTRQDSMRDPPWKQNHRRSWIF